MGVVITAPERVPETGYKVYLAGAIDMGEADNWQERVIARLKNIDNLVLVNPRRAHFTSDTELEQIAWELDAMEAADLIMLWLPAASKAPISLLELGLYARSGKLRVGAEIGFYRMMNVALTASRYGVPLCYKLEELIDDLEVTLVRLNDASLNSAHDS